MKRIIAILLTALMLVGVLAGCGPEEPVKPKRDKLYVVTTVFPYYDFLKNVGGDRIDVELLLTENVTPEDYSPSASDLQKIKEANLLVFTSTYFDSWVDNIKSYLSNNEVTCSELSKCIEIKNINGTEKSDTSSKLDYYIWLSPENSIKVVEELANMLGYLDKGSADYYSENANNYIMQLQELDTELREISDFDGWVSGMVFAETAHFGYMTHSYGINCMSYKQLLETYSDEDAAAEYKKFVADNNIDTIYYSNLDNIERVDNAVTNIGFRQKLELVTCIRPTDTQIAEGVTYIDLMRQNFDAMKNGFHIA